MLGSSLRENEQLGQRCRLVAPLVIDKYILMKFDIRHRRLAAVRYEGINTKFIVK